MGAYWHIALPFEVQCQDKPPQTKMVETLYGGDFRFEHVEEYQVKSPELPDGARLTFDRREKIYRLDQHIWNTEFQPFYLAFLETLQAHIVQRGYRVYSVVTDQELLEPFLSEFKRIEAQNDIESYLQAVEALETNCFLHSYDLPQQVAYHGYPLPSADASSMKIVTLLHSYEKMNVIPEETVMFHNAIDAIKTKLSGSFRLTNYVCVIGF